MASVHCAAFYKAFGEALFPKDVNLTIEDGGVCGVLSGRRAAAKSTLRPIIAGAEDITSGDLLIGEKRMNQVPPSERGIGMVFQSYALIRTVGGGQHVVRPEAGRRQESGMNRTGERGLRGAAAGAPAHLAAEGAVRRQRQRVAIGRTLVAEAGRVSAHEPRPTSTPALRVQMRIDISRLHKRLQRTMIYVIYDQVEAMTPARRLRCDAGRVAQVGSCWNCTTTRPTASSPGLIGSPR